MNETTFPTMWIAFIPLLPLLGFLLVSLLRRKLSEKVLGLLGCAGPLLAFVVAIYLTVSLYRFPADSVTYVLYSWIQSGNLQLSLAFTLDPLSALLCLVITGVGSVIHIYSIGYMHGDKGFGRYFAYLNLFTSMMLVLVLGENLVVMFIGWEGVGLCSYLLIGFWYEDMEKSLAAQKAFVVNRVGDFAFLIGIFWAFFLFGTLSFEGIQQAIARLDTFYLWQLNAIAILFFIGATGKSAQIPLYLWLPDAMAGPTPVSALIHAATMVTAGVYMIGRLSALYSVATFASSVVAIVGALTALYAATMGITQRDIKKILAYSTISQLGYMFLAMGLGAYTLGIFHLTTHAFFKAALFLGAGAVIHAYVRPDRGYPAGLQDTYKMGGLWRQTPLIFFTFIAGGFSLAALPPFSGFFSKDPILATALQKAQTPFSVEGLAWFLGTLTAFCTVIYTFRLIALVFFGQPRGDVRVEPEHYHASYTMGFALVVLSLLSLFGGGLHHTLSSYLQPVWGSSHHTVEISHSVHEFNFFLIFGGSVIFAVVTFYIFAWRFAWIQKVVRDNPWWWWLYFLSYRKYFVDEVCELLIVKPLKRLSAALLKWIDFFLIEGIVNGLPKLFLGWGWAMRAAQNGRVHTYAGLILVGVLLGLLYLGYTIVYSPF
ncbi:MAG: NADH-quinone oxidoreductase subunit L [Planctomycetota bacterium]|nr:MAG: NADH-quinone oxidoreductase subunit L [Planctomycetota bacterium]